MAAVELFMRRQLKRLGLTGPGIDVTDARVVFVLGHSHNTDMQKFCSWATCGEELIQPVGHGKAGNTKEIQWSVCPESRFNPAANSDSKDGKLIFIQHEYSWVAEYPTLTKWLTNNWRGIPKDVSIIYPQDISRYDSLSSIPLLLNFHNACEAANLNIYPLRTVFLTTGWTKENCREMYKKERHWIGVVEGKVGSDPNLAKIIHGEPRFARLMDEDDTVIATVNLLFVP